MIDRENSASSPMHDERPPSANERFKSRSADWMMVGVVAAAAAHYALFALFPAIGVADIDFTADEIESVELPPEVKVPPPPERIARPATPRVAAAALDEDITIARTDFQSNPVESLPPPPAGARPSEVPSYIPRDVEPRLLNADELIEMARQRFPEGLRQAGVRGEVGVFFFVSEHGDVTNAVVQSSCGYEQLDRVALEVARAGKFEPAMIRDVPVGVWIVMPIHFTRG
ncbi:MAG: energy transducer TonB [Gemmatimonadota bacterium]|nr:energy transducer TonB [Gemmatimonadota bacterium]